MISERLKRVILRELNLEDFALDETAKATDVPGWDSLNHVRIITAVETEYGVRFKPLEVIRLKVIGDLQRALDNKVRVGLGKSQ